MNRVRNINKKTLLKSVAIILLAIWFFIVGYTSVLNKSGTDDEKFHMVRGLMLLETGDLRINQHHPYLFNLIEAIPAYLDDDVKIPATEQEIWETAHKDKLSFQLIELNGGELTFAQNVLNQSRALSMLIGSLTLIIFFYLINKEHGSKTAIFSTLLLASSSTFLAHSRFVTTDAPSVITTFLATFTLYRYLKSTDEEISKRYLFYFIVSTTVALLTKYTTVFLVPLWLLFIAIKQFRKVNKSASSRKKRFLDSIKTPVVVVLALLALLTISYKGQFATIREMQYGDNYRLETFDEGLDELELPKPITSTVEFVFNEVPVPFPQYVSGFFDNVIRHDISGHSSYLLGEFNHLGWWYYFPVAFAVKEPVVTVLLTLLLVGFGVYQLFKKKKDILKEPTYKFLLPGTLIFFTIMYLSASINIGVRHLLPMLPLLFWQIGIVLNKLVKQCPQLFYILIALIMTNFISLLYQFPDYTSYYNEIVGRYNGHKVVMSSNLEWDQNNRLIQSYIIENSDKNATGSLYELEDETSHYVTKIESFKKQKRDMSPRHLRLYEMYEQGEIEPVEWISNTAWVFEVSEDMFSDLPVEEEEKS